MIPTIRARRLLPLAIGLFATGVGILTTANTPGLVGFVVTSAGPCTRFENARGMMMHSRVARHQNDIAIQSRLIAADALYEQWETPVGRYWIVKGESNVLFWLLGQQLEHFYGDIPAGIVIDGGAHVGVFVTQALRAGASKVVAIEPAPENLECLRRNFAKKIAEGRVVIYPKGIWDKTDVLQFHRVSGNSAGDSLVHKYSGGDEISIPVTTVDAIVSELALKRVDMIKLDVKGAERQCLAGAQATIRRWKPRLAVASEHNVGDNVELPRLVHSTRSDYAVRCGPCYVGGPHRAIFPEVLLFQ